MESIIEFAMDKDKVVVSEHCCSILQNLFSGCRVSFLLGAGFSAGLLGLLNNNEIIFEAVRSFQTSTEKEKKQKNILLSYLFWNFFSNCIEPIANTSANDKEFDDYKHFGEILYHIFSTRGNPALDRQFNIFTTNYDPIIELIFDHSNCICNDGFEGRISPVFSTDNYAKSYYRQAIFSNRKSEIPSVNLIKLHGSITWKYDVATKSIYYQPYRMAIEQFKTKFATLFDADICKKVESHFTARTLPEACSQIAILFASDIFDSALTNEDAYSCFLREYAASFAIVNPTKEKFSDTLLNKNYYELLRLFTNELEKENVLLVVEGFSFKDEHILDLVKRSMVNPSLKLLVFCYDESCIDDYKNLLGTPKNNNISFVSISGEKLSIKYFNQILSCVRS